MIKKNKQTQEKKGMLEKFITNYGREIKGGAIKAVASFSLFGLLVGAYGCGSVNSVRRTSGTQLIEQQAKYAASGAHNYIESVRDVNNYLNENETTFEIFKQMVGPEDRDVYRIEMNNSGDPKKAFKAMVTQYQHAKTLEDAALSWVEFGGSILVTGAVGKWIYDSIHNGGGGGTTNQGQFSGDGGPVLNNGGGSVEVGKVDNINNLY